MDLFDCSSSGDGDDGAEMGYLLDGLLSGPGTSQGGEVMQFLRKFRHGRGGRQCKGRIRVHVLRGFPAE